MQAIVLDEAIISYDTKHIEAPKQVVPPIVTEKLIYSFKLSFLYFFCCVIYILVAFPQLLS